MFLSFAEKGNAQDNVWLDSEMLSLVIQNQVVRESSELYLQREATNSKNKLQKINEAYIQVVAIHTQLVDALENVNSTFTQIHKVKNIVNQTNGIMVNAVKVAQLCSQHPQYSSLVQKHIVNALQHVTGLREDMDKIALRGSNNLLMNYRERDEIIRTITIRLALINANLVLMRKSLERAIKLGFWKSVVPFGNWVNTDMRMVNDIIRRSKFL